VDPYAWSWSSHALVLVPALTIAYFWALRRVPAPRWRIACWVASMVLLLSVSITPIETISLHFLLSVHLLQNVVLAEWAPLLAVLGIPPALAARAPRVPPLLALALWLVNYGVWHLPWIYDAALHHQHSLLHLEHVLYFATGVLLWWPVFHGDLSSGGKALYLFAAFVLASPIGLMMALVPEPIYDFYVDAPRLWGLSPILDQQIAGVSMAAAESVVFFAFFAFFIARFFNEQDAMT
jgi:cytochrome c oxidase assembly factor CtaG